jgi:hypothetical protein
MKRDWALLPGWAAGVFAGATVLVVLVFLESGGRPASSDILTGILFSVILGAGPGLLLLSWWISVRLKRRHGNGATRGSTLGLGVLVGAVMGVPAVLLVPFLFFGAHILRALSDLPNPEALFMLALGVVSGAATGLTCAWRVSKPS